MPKAFNLHDICDLGKNIYAIIAAIVSEFMVKWVVKQMVLTEKKLLKVQ